MAVPKLSSRGCWAAGIYLSLAAAVYTFLRMHPSEFGYEWIPFIWMAAPWSIINPRLLLFPGFVVNALLLYFLAASTGSSGERPPGGHGLA